MYNKKYSFYFKNVVYKSFDILGKLKVLRLKVIFNFIAVYSHDPESLGWGNSPTVFPVYVRHCS